MDQQSEDLVFATTEQQRLFEIICVDLPNFPLALVYHWLLPFAEELGWPPDYSSHDTEHLRWRRILKRPIISWARVQWKLESLDVLAIPFPDSALLGFQDMTLGHAFGQQNLQTLFLGESSKTRFWRQVINILNTGSFLEPPAIVWVEGKAVPVDGNHRLAALYFVMNAPQARSTHERHGHRSQPLAERHQFWVGDAPAGDMWSLDEW